MINNLNNTTTNTGSSARRNLILGTSGAAMLVLLAACGTAATTDGYDEGAGEKTDSAEAVEAGSGEAPIAASSDAEPTAELVAAPATTEAPAAPTAPTPVPDATTASAADAAPAQLIPASSPDLPCATYTEVTELPAHACSQGEPVSIFQNWVAYTDPSFEVDGYFGQSTYDAVISFQLMYGLEPTGVIDDALMYVIEADHNEVHGEPVILPIDEGECDLADADENC